MADDMVSGSGGLGDVEFDDSGTATGIDDGGDDDDDGDDSDFADAMEGLRESADEGELEGQAETGDADRDTQLEQETGTSTEDVESGEAAAPPTDEEDLTTAPEQDLGPSGDETSGFEDPDRVELDELRYAGEETAEETPGDETTIAGETYREGEALPTDRDVARMLERQVVDETPALGREDVGVRRTDDGLVADLTAEGESQLDRQMDYRRRQARIEARREAERDLETQLSVSQRSGQPGPGGVEFSPVDLQRGEDFTFEQREGGGVRTQLTDSFLRERAASQFDAIGPNAIRVENGDVELTQEGRRAVIESRVAEDRDLDPGREFTVEFEDGDPSVELTDQGKIEVAGRTDAPSGDVIASTEGWLRRQAAAHRVGEGAIPNLDSASNALAGAQAQSGPLESGAGTRARNRAAAVRAVGRESLNPAAIALGFWGTGKLLVDTTLRRERVIETPDAMQTERGEEWEQENAPELLGTKVRRQVAETLRTDPNALAKGAGMAIAGAAGGAAAGRALGFTARAARRRARTVGGTEVDLEDLTQEEVIRGVDPDRPGGDDFPGAQDPDLYESDPPAAVRQQAGDMTPEEVDELFRRHGVDELTTLKKAIEVEPEGPRRGRAGQGLRTQAGDYESPGAFAGPELSPYFLGEGRQAAGWSWRPGLPDTGESPTGVLVRTGVERPDADDMGQFRREIQERAGETTARTKPAGDVNTREIEAVIPPEAEFAPLPQSRTQSVARRLGIGSRLYTELPDGRRVPLRPVAPASAIDDAPSRGLRDLLSDDRAQLGAAGRASRRTYSLDELARAGSAGTDRPLPLAPSVGSTSRAPDADDYATDYEAPSTSAVGRSTATTDYSRPRVSAASSGAGSGVSEGPLGGSYLSGGSGASSTAGQSTVGESSTTSVPGVGGQPIDDPSIPSPGLTTDDTPGTNIPTTRLPDDDEDDDEDPEAPIDDETDDRDRFDAGLGPGWYSEYVTALALGSSAPRGSPGQDVLEDRPESEAYTSTLPTEAQVSGTDEQQEAIDEAYATLTFGGDGDDGGSEGADPFDFGGSGGSWF